VNYSKASQYYSYLFLDLRMANWTTEQVAEWLKKEGFEQFIKVFKGNQTWFSVRLSIFA